MWRIPGHELHEVTTGRSLREERLVAVLELMGEVREVVVWVDEYSHGLRVEESRRSLVVISNSWEYGTRNLLCTSLMFTSLLLSDWTSC